MESKKIRQTFLDFFAEKGHKLVDSAPMVIKDDPTLMFTNAGMNQFKDIFLGSAAAKHLRVANSQKCLRVSGKHNDLEEVGVDTYHHTMFEMLGNWSFGDYFKKEAIDWAWELLVEVFQISEDRLYATIFEGNEEVERDTEAYNLWRTYLPEDRVLNGNAKDNFWEMGDMGPCGPCSEVHIDLRDEAERKLVSGASLVNQDHPLVVEIWNLVFIQFNRKGDKSLEKLAQTHVDTGMGFERLCMALQGKKSNYDTDVFQPIIQKIAQLSGKTYGEKEEIDIAMRVVADHLRTLAFSIAEAQLPSNNKAGYVIKRILRRAIRYGYTFLGQNEPFIYKLVGTLVDSLGEHFTELVQQRELIEQVIKEEEQTFLRTLEKGIVLLEGVMEKAQKEGQKIIDGEVVFKLYDTYGFPYDLTELISKERGMLPDKEGFDLALEKQRAGSRTSVAVTDEWTELQKREDEDFVGYDSLDTKVKIVQYRTVEEKKKKWVHLVFDKTPFYGESGGQVGDVGYIESENGTKYSILKTIKEHNMIVHVMDKLPENMEGEYSAVVNSSKRKSIAQNHTATHLLHFALRKILGEHVEQKGSLVAASHLHFDFSHFQKVTTEQLLEVERYTNELIQKNLQLEEKRSLPISEAKEMGAIALFGEKYGDSVRVIKYGDSVELCGGTHVQATGEIGLLKIVSESSIASGVRRIEALAGMAAQAYVEEHVAIVKELEQQFKAQSSKVLDSVTNLRKENQELKQQLEAFEKEAVKQLKQTLKDKQQKQGEAAFIVETLELERVAAAKDLAFQLKGEVSNLILILGIESQGKAQLTIMLADHLVETYGLHAGTVVREAAKLIGGSGGGQAFFASAGGKDPKGLKDAVAFAQKQLMEKLG